MHEYSVADACAMYREVSDTTITKSNSILRTPRIFIFDEERPILVATLTLNNRDF